MNENEIVYVGYGIGCSYDSIAGQIKKKFSISYLCDRKWEKGGEVYDHIPVISKSKLLSLPNVRVIIFPSDLPIKKAIARELKEMGVEYIFAEELLGKRQITGRLVKEEGVDGVWKDQFNNVIYYHSSIPDEVLIQLDGIDNVIYLEENIVVNDLMICMGNKGTCRIGANTRIVGVDMYIAYASVKIGKDCLFSKNVMIRTHDAHHIFDRNTHERINIPKDVVLHNHVWIGEGVFLLPGAEIGEGCVVGARAVTSSRFEDHVVVVGAPAKVVRRDICWSKDATDCTNYSCAEGCATDDALRYC